MNLTALKTWVSGETLTATDLNGEFQNIYTHTITNSDIDSTGTYVLGELVVGSGITAADGGQFHVHTASAGSVQAHADADEAVLENSAASGLSILSGSSSDGNIFFGDAADNDVGKIAYSHSANSLAFTTNGATALTLSSAQAATFAGDVTVGGALTLTGGLTLNGAVVVGDSASDTLTVNATVTSDLLFTDATYDIGKSGATRPRDGFFSRNMAVGGTLGVTGATTLSSTLGVTGALTATAGITSGSDIVSDSDSTDDLGTTSVRWANLYVDSIGDTGQALAITAGSNNINVTAGTLALTGAQTISSTLGVTGLITASGGVSGNVTGNLTGDVTGNISGNVTGGTISGTTGTFSGDVAIGAASAGNKLDIITGNTLQSAVHIGEVDNEGFYISSIADNGTYLSVGAELDTSWYARATSSVIFGGEGGAFNVWVDGSLTDGSTFSPTNRLSLDSSGDLAVDTDTLYVDASADRVGIGTSSPSSGYSLDIANSSSANVYIRTTASSDTANSLAIEGYRTNGSAGYLSRIEAKNRNGSVAITQIDSETESVYNSGALVFKTASTGTMTERARIDSSGRLLVGTSSSTGANSNTGLVVKSITNANSSGEIILQNGYANTLNANSVLGSFLFQDSSGDTYAQIKAEVDAQDSSSGDFPGRLVFSVTADGSASPTERARIDSSGNLLVGYTSSNGSYKLQVNSQIFATNATIATSDGRYKEEVQTLSNATDLVTRLNPVQFRWKAHGIHNLDVGKTDVGFIAQEVQAVLSDTDYSDSVVVNNKTDDEEYLGLGETKLIPLLTAALQEAITKIETLETKVAALEAA